MRRFRLITFLLLVPGLAALATVSGCGKDKTEQTGGGQSGEKAKDRGTSAHAGVPTAEVPSKGWGTLQGKVTYDGDPPATPDPDIQKDRPRCACKEAADRGDTKQQRWKLGPDKGVANVVVWVRAPKGKYFKIPDDQKKRTDTVTLEQPFCAFEPHVLVLYPSYYDPVTKSQTSTGQKFEIINNATIPHNTNVVPNGPVGVSGDQNLLLPPGKKEPKNVTLDKPKSAGAEPSVTFTCNIHTWMTGSGRVFDHPFYAVTKGDKQKEKSRSGEYEIKEVPAGVDLDLVYWHEALGNPISLGTIKLEDGKTLTKDFKIKK